MHLSGNWLFPGAPGNNRPITLPELCQNSWSQNFCLEKSNSARTSEAKRCLRGQAYSLPLIEMMAKMREMNEVRKMRKTVDFVFSVSQSWCTPEPRFFPTFRMRSRRCGGDFIVFIAAIAGGQSYTILNLTLKFDWKCFLDGGPGGHSLIASWQA